MPYYRRLIQVSNHSNSLISYRSLGIFNVVSTLNSHLESLLKPNRLKQDYLLLDLTLLEIFLKIFLAPGQLDFLNYRTHCEIFCRVGWEGVYWGVRLGWFALIEGMVVNIVHVLYAWWVMLLLL
jgi:hypothetical protein